MSSADGTPIGLLTDGVGPALVLVRGGMGQVERWSGLWPSRCDRWQVTATDRRGRGSGWGAADWSAGAEVDDVLADAVTHDHGAPVDVLAHSIGTTTAIGVAAHGAPTGP